MHLNLSPELQGNAAAEEAARIVGKCVHCGFCNASCPTYRLLGDELDGPRGRIYLMKGLLEGVPATAAGDAGTSPDDDAGDDDRTIDPKGAPLLFGQAATPAADRRLFAVPRGSHQLLSEQLTGAEVASAVADWIDEQLEGRGVIPRLPLPNMI